GFDPQFLKDLRVAQRELDHLPDQLEFPFEPANILVLDRGDLPFPLFRVERLILELDLRVIGYDGDGPGGDKGHGIADDIDPQRLALDDRPPPQDPGKVLLSPDEPGRLSRLDHHFCGIYGLGFADLHLLIDAGIRVRTDTPVDTQDGKPDILGKARPDDRRRVPLPHDFDDIS